MRRGSNIKDSVKWENADDGSQNVWWRKGEVTFKLVKLASVTPPNVKSTWTTIPPVAAENCQDASIAGNTDNYKSKMSEFAMSPSSNERKSPLESCEVNFAKLSVEAPSAKDDHPMEKIFESIKTQCLNHPNLLKKVVKWVLRNNPEDIAFHESISILSQGRLWIKAYAVNRADGNLVQEESLDDMKGAYQEFSSGVYKQPDPETSGSELQHRLLKDENGCWMIEKHDLKNENCWLLRAQQLPDGRWVDVKNNRRLIQVQLIPFIKVLERLGEEIFDGKRDVKKSLDFLFLECNQKKLMTKLKGRNLRHNIVSLKVKIAKRCGLSFGLRVVNTANNIALESLLS